MTKVVECIEFYKNTSIETLPNEVWKHIPQMEGFYMASNLGRIKSLGRIVKCGRNGELAERMMSERIIRQKKENKGYLRISVSILGRVKTYSVHRLIAAAFLGESSKCVNHKDFNPSNNTIENLEYMTYSENVSYSYRAGRLKSKVGVLNNSNKLSESQVLQIREIYNRGEMYQYQIADIFKIDQSTVSNIVNKKVWVHI